MPKWACFFRKVLHSKFHFLKILQRGRTKRRSWRFERKVSTENYFSFSIFQFLAVISTHTAKKVSRMFQMPLFSDVVFTNGFSDNWTSSWMPPGACFWPPSWTQPRRHRLNRKQHVHFSTGFSVSVTTVINLSTIVYLTTVCNANAMLRQTSDTSSSNVFLDSVSLIVVLYSKIACLKSPLLQGMLCKMP